MMKDVKKYYVVWKGRNTGIFSSWNDCKQQIFEFEGALYKSFKTLKEAEDAFKKPYQNEKKTKPLQKKIDLHSGPVLNSIAVDAAWSTSTLKMEYQGVYVATKKLLFHQGPFEDGTNNIGEFLGIVHALAFCKKNHLSHPIYSDSVTAIAWIKKKKANTKLELTTKNIELFQLIERAEFWLKNNTWSNKIMKWETQLWGEIPADFGRK